ncbi:DUF4190 domain-containing protein [Streptomyces sp. CA-294286]|uniref:DUF4190 domain-containing protein n=1 Tax=Streptomyces sp. CA-294286 TaxID=3240070 RepID=UPI003D922AA7
MSSFGSSSRTHSPARSGTNGLAVAGLVCGILGLFFLQIVLGPLAIIFGIVAYRQTRGSGMSKAAIGLGVADLIVFALLMTLVASTGGFTWYVGG